MLIQKCICMDLRKYFLCFTLLNRTYPDLRFNPVTFYMNHSLWHQTHHCLCFSPSTCSRRLYTLEFISQYWRCTLWETFLLSNPLHNTDFSLNCSLKAFLYTLLLINIKHHFYSLYFPIICS